MKTIKLWENGAPFFDRTFGQDEPEMTYYPASHSDDAPNGCVIVCPGGGYEFLADIEGEPIAKRFNEAGIDAFVLRYRITPYRHPVPMMDALRAVRVVRSLSVSYGIDPNKIALMGSSAGGHLVLSALSDYDHADDTDYIGRFSARPDAVIVSYPVVTLDDRFTHADSKRLLIGGLENEGELEVLLSAEKNVRDDTPPVFLWHCADDSFVPVENSLMYAAALSAKKIPFELHVFPKGDHGNGLTANVPGAREWSRLACDWLHRLGF